MVFKGHDQYSLVFTYDGLTARLGTPIGHEVDPAKERAGELRRIEGDATCLRALGWIPKLDLDAILDGALGSD